MKFPANKDMQTRPGRVLIADDEETFAQAVAEKTRLTLNAQVVIAASGREAIEVLEAEQFDVALLDYSMPEMSGLNVLQWMNEQKNETPVVMLTGAGSEHIAVEAMKLGAYDYARKDQVDLDRILLLLSASYERHLFRKEKERREKEEEEFKARRAAIEMAKDTIGSISRFVSNALAVVKSELVNQDAMLKDLVPPDRRMELEQFLSTLSAEMRVISTGVRALTEFSDIVYRSAGIEKTMPELQQELQATLVELQESQSE